MQATPLHSKHQSLNAKLVDFAGWDMPLHYGSQIQEHHAVRQKAGVFDVSHMGVIDITGTNASSLLHYALANNIDKLSINNKGLYSCLLNPQGGIIDDLIVYRIDPTHYRLVINAAGRETDLNWIRQLNQIFDATITPRFDLCILAIQGPEARHILTPYLGKDILNLKRFHCLHQNDSTIARTGYTGEDGLECILPTKAAEDLWDFCIEHGIRPCGLGCRDSLRLEAGLNLYGTDMTTDTSPLTSNLKWTVCFKDETRDFVGKSALITEQNRGLKQQLCGVTMTTPGVLRCHQDIYADGEKIGEITSGGFSPSLGHAIGMARLPIATPSELYIDRRGKKIPILPHTLPFTKAGEYQSTQGESNANTMP